MYGKKGRLKSTRKKYSHVISKQETTKLKIELSGDAIRAENKRRLKHNNSRAVSIGKTPPLPIIRPSFVGVSTRRHVTMSNKYLCGQLSVLCDAMSHNGIQHPWR